jgi:hypothetical protein
MPGGNKTDRFFKKLASFLLFLFPIAFWAPEALCQVSETAEKALPVRIGAIVFQVREIEATPSPIQMLEVQIEIINRSQKVTVPPNTVKLVAAPKEITFPSSRPASPFAPSTEEVMLTHPLPPMAIRIMVIGFPVPKERPESISFEVQINPPEGEKKTVTYKF